MATTLTNGETYVFAKVNNKAVITSGTDDAYQSTKNIRTNVAITGNTDIIGDIKVGDSPSGAAQIHISSSSNPRILIEDDTESFVRLGIKTADTHDAYLGFHDNKRLVIGDMSSRTSTIPSSDLVISSSYVGIGTNAPTNTFHVKKNVSGYLARFENTNEDNASSDGIVINIGPTASGSMTTANKWITFEDGDGTWMGSISGTGGSGPGLENVSDRKLKRDIVTTEYGITELLNLEVVDFKWKSSGESSTGFIAQQVEEVYPQVVSKPSKPEIPYSMNYAGLSPLIVKAIQDQNKIIEDLKSRICELEKNK